MNNLIDEVSKKLEELRDTISKVEKEEKVGFKINAQLEVIFYNIDELKELVYEEKRKKLKMLYKIKEGIG